MELEDDLVGLLDLFAFLALLLGSLDQFLQLAELLVFRELIKEIIEVINSVLVKAIIHVLSVLGHDFFLQEHFFKKVVNLICLRSFLDVKQVFKVLHLLTFKIGVRECLSFLHPFEHFFDVII